ncbi:MAG: hypothetical protein ACO239_09350 [Sediminibacterium sp.]|jgi:hypothetical protein
MPNVVEKYGLRPSRQLNGSPFINAQNRYRIAANNTTAIFQGDLVKPLTSGTISRAVANTSDAVVGVFNGCFYTDPTTQKPTFSNYYPGSVNASDIIAMVIDGPDTVYEVKADATFVVADLFRNYSITNETGSTQTGISKVTLDVSESGTAGTFVVQAIDISQDVFNSDVNASSNVGVLVRINNHFYRQGGTGI